MGLALGGVRLRPEPPPRRLRVRAEPQLLEQLAEPRAFEAARLRLPTWESFAPGDRLRVELSFGALADEVELWGQVVEVDDAAPAQPRTILLAIQYLHGDRIDYVKSVLLGERQATPRRCRRIDVDLRASWHVADARFIARVLDLSRRGAFVCSRHLPSLGHSIELDLTLESNAELSVMGTVSWLRRHGPTRGFGMMFRIDDRRAADRLAEALRACE